MRKGVCAQLRDYSALFYHNIVFGSAAFRYKVTRSVRQEYKCGVKLLLVVFCLGAESCGFLLEGSHCHLGLLCLLLQSLFHQAAYFSSFLFLLCEAIVQLLLYLFAHVIEFDDAVYVSLCIVAFLGQFLEHLFGVLAYCF